MNTAITPMDEEKTRLPAPNTTTLNSYQQLSPKTKKVKHFTVNTIRTLRVPTWLHEHRRKETPALPVWFNFRSIFNSPTLNNYHRMFLNAPHLEYRQ